MIIKSIPTYYCNIFLGLKEGYDGTTHGVWEVANIVEKYCTKELLGVTVTETNYIYVDGREKGVIIGLINYPRFPSENETIYNHAKELGLILAKKFKQQRFTIQTPIETVLYDLTIEPEMI